MLFERQQYQEDCVHNILSVLRVTNGQCHVSRDKLREAQDRDGIQARKMVNARRLDVLMETGTGKTFTYLKTMYEMNRRFGINKFVVFVPRIAIRAVVVQNIALTADYFFQEYGKRIKKHKYGDKGGLGQVFDYIRNENEFSVLILTSSSITSRNKADRILTSRNEGLPFSQKSPLNAIAELNPVVFIDEPHLLKGAGFVESYWQHFTHSLRIRFGATFPADSANSAGSDDSSLSNVVYMLDSLTSFNEYLVKKIRVSTVVDGDSNIKFYRPANGERKHIDISYFKNGVEYRRTIAFGVNLAGVTEIGEYNFSVLKIDDNGVILSDRTRRKLSTSDYSLSSDSIRRMIRQTIIIHFEKEEELFTRNIKTLSLFFIPGIRDFRGENPRIKTIFDEEYAEQRKIVLQKNLNPVYRNYLRNDYDDEGKLRIREGYFSGDRGSRDMKELNGVNIILNNKPKLLSIAEPLRFIFSVWALQEGWDNPNVFTICKLAPTDKETSRRQQVGRGLRLAVDNNGKRQTLAHCSENEESFYTINMLDLVVSGHEKNFIEEIQNEIIGDSITHKQLTSAALAKLKLNASHIARLTVFLEDNNIIRISRENDQVWEIVSPVADFLAANKEHVPPILRSVYDVLVSAFRKAMSSPVENRNRPTDMVGIRAAKFREFEELWKTITQKAKIVYRNIDEEALIHEIKTAFDRETIHPKEMRIIEKTYNHKDNSIETRESTIGDAQFFTTHSYAAFITNFAGNENLSLSFCRKLFNTLNKDKIRNDPGRASELLAKIFKDSLHKTIVQGIGYQFDGEIAINSRRSVYGRQ